MWDFIALGVVFVMGIVIGFGKKEIDKVELQSLADEVNIQNNALKRKTKSQQELIQAMKHKEETYESFVRDLYNALESAKLTIIRLKRENNNINPDKNIVKYVGTMLSYVGWRIARNQKQNQLKDKFYGKCNLA